MINTADNLIGIFTSRAMRERGRYQIQLMKTRSSSGVGTKIDLGFDVDTLRIFDLGEDGEQQTTATSGGNSIVAALQRNSKSANTDTVREDPAEGDSMPKIRAETSSTKLRDFLNNLGTE
jgi:hypothetical protein